MLTDFSLTDLTLPELQELQAIWKTGSDTDGDELDPFPLVECNCGHCHRERTFICSSCERSVWWCQGADDDYPDLCAWCWNDVQNLEWRVRSC